MYEKFKTHAQRHVCPLFLKDELGGFDFSSTTTFIKRKNEYFCVFAAHALPRGETTLKNIGFLLIDGSFMSLEDTAKGYSIDRENDLIICCTTGAFDKKNYFDLDVEYSIHEYKEDTIGWIGFPKKKVKQKYHRSQASPEQIKKDLSTFDDGRLKWTNANYLLLGLDGVNKSHHKISASFNDENVNYEKEGFKEKAYSLKGMSGGAFFHTPKQFNQEPQSISEFFKFAGIGLEHYKTEKLVKGANVNLVIELIDNHISST